MPVRSGSDSQCQRLSPSCIVKLHLVPAEVARAGLAIAVRNAALEPPWRWLGLAEEDRAALPEQLEALEARHRARGAGEPGIQSGTGRPRTEKAVRVLPPYLTGCPGSWVAAYTPPLL